MKYTARILSVFLALSLTGCVSLKTKSAHVGAWFVSHGPQFKDTGGYLVKKVAGIAIQGVIGAAVSSQDANKKADFLDSFALGVRTHGLENLATKDDWTTLAAIWTPDKPHWAELATGISTELKKTGKVNPAKLEEIAKGLNLAAAQTRAADAKP